MKIIAILVLVFGVALAGGAIYFASNYFAEFEARMRANQPKGPKTVNVIVAKTSLAYGTVIKPKQHLRWAEWPEDSLPPGVFTDAEELLGERDSKDDTTRIVLRKIEAGEPILESKISGFGERARMALNLDEGRRAFTIRTDAVAGVAGFVNPGDRVDVMLIRNTRDGLESTVILQNMRVIATDRDTNQETNNPRVASTVTMDVSQTEAQKLHLAQQLGRLTLTLRSMQEEVAESERPEAVDVKDLLGIEDTAAPAPAPERDSTTVIIRRGGAVSDRLKFFED